MKASDLVAALGKKLKAVSMRDLASELGVSQQTLINWNKQASALKPNQVATVITKSRQTAVARSQDETIRPIVEFYPIDMVETKQDKGWEVFGAGNGTTLYAQGLKDKLQKVHGIYVFYDSSGHALYVGKAREQNVWKEMNLAFNRQRAVQKIRIVHHPDRNQQFKSGHERQRQPIATQLKLFDLAYYFSVYKIDVDMIDNLEALMVRAFSNDLLNVKMEKFKSNEK